MKIPEDNYRHKGLRRDLVQLLRSKGITDEQVLEAIGKVPRHFYFTDSIFDQRAYEDQAFQIGEGQTISQPFTVAYQTQLLRIKPMEKVLEIGTGSGYQASVLQALGARVYTIERQRKLFDRTKILLEKLQLNSIKMFYGDGFEGLPMFAPFDKILVTAAAPELPIKLLRQLKPGGLLVIPLDDPEEGTVMRRFTLLADNTLHEERFLKFSFVPMLKGKAG